MTDAEKNFVSIHNPSTGEVLHKFYYQFLSDKFIACPYFACVNEDDQLIVTDMRNNQIKVRIHLVKANAKNDEQLIVTDMRNSQIKVRLHLVKANAKNDVASRWVFVVHIE